MPGNERDAILPSNWPREVIYINRPVFAAGFPPALKKRLQPKPNVSRVPKSKSVKIQLITDSSHPADGQRGLFAAVKIAPSTHILDYLGEVHCDERPNSDYDLSLLRLNQSDTITLGLNDDFIAVGVDAAKMGNEARFINDYRATQAVKPNAEFRERTLEGESRMSVWSGIRGISKGEEILVSYGKAWWRARMSGGSDDVGQNDLVSATFSNHDQSADASKTV